MSGFWRHLRALWPGWTILAPLPFVLHAFWAISQGLFHWENVAILAAALSLFSIGPRTKKLFLGVYPLGLVGLLYDTMKLIENVGVSAESVHLCDLRALEIKLFGVTVNGRPGTVHDWFQLHSSPLLDRLCAIPYATFIFVCCGCAIWLYFKDYAGMQRFTWCFLALNVAGFITYHVYPAAPPWYFHSHGCAIDVNAHASEGPNLARVDAWLGVKYFAGMYGRASDVFGAMPSLHVAYSLIVVLVGWATFRPVWRGASLAFFFLMAFSAVYLDHHWVLDAVAGIVYCTTVVSLSHGFTRLRAARSTAHAASTQAVASPEQP
ncbi:MAG TPA: phosphatase PAP2 family protein [Polyangiaceae bacterium]|jgi:membrane-associated phospholipid phosphatase|nr:phosphatase PAP2 family protein [Polyangiaceae bacterium]